jgi:hypothetical protein
MKIWLEKTSSYQEHIKIGINWYKHSPKHKWKGFTLELVFFTHMVVINAVNSYRLYREYFDERERKRERYRLKLLGLKKGQS